MPRTRSGATLYPGRQKPISDPLIRQVIQTIGQHDMLHPGDILLVGVSSGPDSVVLLHALHTLAPRLNIGIAVAHLDHGLRPEAAAAELALVGALAQRLGLICHTDKLTVPLEQGSMEEQLRQLRYAFFKRTAVAHGYTKVALGHHADDNAEAVLMHLLRGSGLRGLSGIPPVRGNWIIRPMIAVRRTAILDYANRHRLNYMQDASNLDTRFERNKIRHQLIPYLERNYNPNLIPTLNRTAALCREEDRWLTSHVAPLAARMTVRSNVHTLELRMDTLTSAPRALQRHLVRAALEKWQGHLRRIGADHIDTLLSLLDLNQRERRLHLPNQVIAETTDTILRFRRVLHARQDAGVPPAHFLYTLDAVGQIPVELRIPEAHTILRFSLTDLAQAGPLQVSEQQMILLDMARLVFPLSVRNFHPGDHFRPFGLQGHQKVKKLLIDRKIPRPHRARIPLLISADAILWVVGVRRGSQAAIAPETSRVLRVQADFI